ncbi:hypothetical protein LEP1GSC036_2432 [Leptospira weilii str. 2006001853]|uniref:Uncharacterized protein n=1 Tax=Leptospira weilii str. 2006001853 TaxID=1001589 RepID=A0A828YXW6_9LEPT|nr:hypothetical protein LEP1GSC036_2432 [Leptospira weilii str. 2006001853]EMN45211.1 hypothetical protein LEP1GSC086_1243 [Leptospira weilii str. LNT 1234]
MLFADFRISERSVCGNESFRYFRVIGNHKILSLNFGYY